MRIRKSVWALLFGLCMMLLCGLPVHAASNSAVTVKRTASGKYYLFDRQTDQPVSGRIGFVQIPEDSGYCYYFLNQKGRIRCGELFRKNGLYYYAARDGHLITGGATINQNRYYFDKKTFAAVIGWKKIGKNWYYYGKTGIKATGWLSIGGETYYLDPNQAGARISGWKVIDKKAYYFNSAGVRQTGLLMLNGITYYLDPSEGGARKTGWVTVSGNTYFMSKNTARRGQAIIGWAKIEGDFYYFNSQGILQKGWLVVGDRRYYLDPATGKRVTGTRVINGYTYDFGTRGYVLPTGAWTIQVNKGTGVVTIFRGGIPVKALLCSVGNPTSLTPNGTFYLGVKHRWWTLFGNVYGQYTTQITGNILFHSVFYRVNGDNHTLYTNEYNRLGSPASHGCVRLNVAGAKYIYENCPSGTKVTVFYGTSADDPLGKPAHIYAYGNYDPTDPYA